MEPPVDKAVALIFKIPSYGEKQSACASKREAQALFRYSTIVQQPRGTIVLNMRALVDGRSLGGIYRCGWVIKLVVLRSLFNYCTINLDIARLAFLYNH